MQNFDNNRKRIVQRRRYPKSVKIRLPIIVLLILLAATPSSLSFTTPSSSLVTSRKLDRKLPTSTTISGVYDLDISIDTPVLGPPSSSSIAKGLASSLLKDGSKVALAAWVLMLLYSLRKPFWRSFQGINSALKSVGRKISAVRLPSLNFFRKNQPEVVDYSENGWGVGSFVSKQRLGKTHFTQYNFNLPQRHHYLGLSLGQEASLCSLDRKGNVVKGSFYTYSPNGVGEKSELGRFSILVPDEKDTNLDTFMGNDNAEMIRILSTEFKAGDEIAVQPGASKLEYNGDYTPVTDMVYIAESTGIVPVLDQVRAVLPDGSSVKSVNVIWVNEKKENFDVVSDLLEAEYIRYKTKLAVDCVVDNLQHNSLADSGQLEEAIPEYFPGVMAVLSGSPQMQENAKDYLVRKRGYPQDCICLL